MVNLMRNLSSALVKPFLLVIPLIFTNNFSRAQSDYREGYIITPNHDTISGWLNLNNNRCFQTCEFRKQKDSKSIIYTPIEIEGYRFANDKFFIAKDLLLRNSYEKYEQVSFKGVRNESYIDSVWVPVPGYHEERVFLEYLLNGQINFFYYKDESKVDHYFLQKGNDSLVEITSEVVKVFHNAVLFSEHKNEIFKKILQNEMKEFPQLIQKIGKLELDHKSIIEIGTEYHKLVCSDRDCIVYERSLKPVTKSVRFYSGLGNSSISRIHVMDSENPYPAFYDNLYWMAGAGIQVYNLIQQSDKFSAVINLEFSNNRYNYNQSLKQNNEDTTLMYSADFKNIILEVRLLQYFTTKRSSPYFGAGLYGNYTFGLETKDHYSAPPFIRIDNSDFKKITMGAVVNIGYSLPLSGNSQELFVELFYRHLFGKQYNFGGLIGFQF
jgi:hypothetical protein